MAFMVARTEKRKVGSLGGYQNHVDRKTDNHSNKDIDNSKTHLNYDLVGHETDKSFHKEFMDYINENRVGSRAVRKDAVVMQDWIIGSSQEFFDALTPEDTRKYFETAVEFFAEKFGRENIRFATVHMDEKTPHMHMGIVPLKDGKLTAKTIFDRNCLRMIQDKLPQAFQNAGFDIQRGKEKSEAEHLHPETYKRQMEKLEFKVEENIKDVVYEPLLEQISELFNKLEEFGMTEENTPKTMEIANKFIDSEGYIDSKKLKKWDVFRFVRTAFEEIGKFIGSLVQKLAIRSSKLDFRENTLIEREKSLEAKLEGISKEVEKFENIKRDFDVLIDDMNPSSKFNKNIDDALSALESYDKALEEEDWIEAEDYSSEDEIWKELEDCLIPGQNFSGQGSDKITWDENPLWNVVRKGFCKDIQNDDGSLKRRVPWSRQEIKWYLDGQVEERAKLKFDVSEIKENIAEQKANLLNRGLDRGYGRSR